MKDFLLTINTDNWVAIRQAFRVLEALDDPAATAFSPTLAGWAVSALPDEPWLFSDLVRSVQQLASDGKGEAAFALAKASLSELASSNPSSLKATRTFGRDLVAFLAQSAPGLATAADALRQVLEREYETPEADKARYVRRTIELHRTSLPDDSTLGLMIDLVRDTLQVSQDATERARVVEELLHSKWPTERRVGIAHCFLLPSDLADHEASTITYENLSNPHLFHELAKLVVERGDDLSEASVRVLEDFADRPVRRGQRN